MSKEHIRHAYLKGRITVSFHRLEDLYENILLETQADRITPLATNPGRIMLTSSRLYFQPFNNIDRVSSRMVPVSLIFLSLSILRLEEVCVCACTPVHLWQIVAQETEASMQDIKIQTHKQGLSEMSLFLFCGLIPLADMHWM